MERMSAMCFICLATSGKISGSWMPLTLVLMASNSPPVGRPGVTEIPREIVQAGGSERGEREEERELRRGDGLETE